MFHDNEGWCKLSAEQKLSQGDANDNYNTFIISLDYLKMYMSRKVCLFYNTFFPSSIIISDMCLFWVRVEEYVYS